MRDFITDTLRIILFQNANARVGAFSDVKWIPRSVRRPLISCSATRERGKKIAIRDVTLASNLRLHFCHLEYRSDDKKTSLCRASGFNTSRQRWRAGFAERR